MTIIIAKSIASSGLPLETLGAPNQEIPASGQVTLTLYNKVNEIQGDEQLKSHINNGEVTLNVDGTDLNQPESLNIATTVVASQTASLSGLVLNDLKDVNVLSPTMNQSLAWDGSEWAPSGVAGGDGGQTDTIVGSNGITNVGNNVNADMAPTYGTGANTICEGDDARLSDARTPLAHSIAGSEHTADTLANLNTKVSDATLIDTNDSRLSDARTPLAHSIAGTEHTADTLANLNTKVSDATLIDTGDSRLSDDRTADGIRTATTIVSVSAAAAPSAGQVLKATGGTAATWQDESGGASFPSYLFSACSLDFPNDADWAVNDYASIGADSNNGGLFVRRFDDGGGEGIGFTLEIPAGASNIKFKFHSRAETAPGGAQTVSLDGYERELPDNAAVTAWSSAISFANLSMPTNENWQDDEEEFTLAAFGLTADSTHQFEIVRDGTGSLVGDWTLLTLVVEFS